MTTGHLDAEQLAEHAEGLLAPDDAEAVESHLQTCETCQTTAEGLASVSAMLAAAPPDLPTPAHVVAQLDRALAEEAAPEPALAPVVQLSWFRRRAPQLLGAAATVGVLGFAGWVVSTTGSGGDDASESADAGAEVADTSTQSEGGARDDSAGEDADEEAATAPLQADGEGAVPAAELEEEIRVVAEQARTAGGDAAGDACGMPLADELGLELVGTAATELASGDPGVLVVLQSDDPAFVHGWVVPACDAAVDDAHTQLTVELD